MRKRGNEGRACDAVVRVLEARDGAARANVTHPEKEHADPPVELRLDLGSQSYAIEHTQIEAFPNQIRLDAEFESFIRPVLDELSERLPGSAIYHLRFPIDARLGVAADQLENIRSEFIAWVRHHSQRLHDNDPSVPTSVTHPRGVIAEYRGVPPRFPYEVSLSREAHWSLSPQHDGVLTASRIAPDNVEKLRAERLRTSLERKCPKLQRCKKEGVRTVLVLEDNDIALSNHVLIGECLSEQMQQRADLPDEIYLVDTTVSTWAVRMLKFDSDYLPDVGWSTFDPAHLIDIT